MAYKHPENWRDFIDSLHGVSLSLGERAVLQAHYKFADKDGRNCRVTAAKVAKYLRTSESTVRKYRSGLIKAGWLILRHRGHNTGTENAASTFDVVIPTGLAISPPPRRAPRNRTGTNQHTKSQQVNGYLELQVKQTSKPRSQQVTDSCLPVHPETDAVGRASDNAVVAGVDPHVQSGLPQAASGSGPGLAVGGEPSAQHVAGADSGSAEVSSTNENDPPPPPQDPWGPAPEPPPNHHTYEYRHDLDEEF